MTNANRPTVGIYYACFGHWTLAAQRARLKVLWHYQPNIYKPTEDDKTATMILSANFPKIHTREPSKGSSRYMELVDIVLGSPPCIGLSSANPTAGLKHPANKNILEFWSTIMQLKPKAFVMEMVPQILTIGKPILVVAQKIVTSEYNVAIGDYEASLHGSPSRRHRIYFIGVQRKLEGHRMIAMIADSLPRHDVVGVKKVTADLSDKYDKVRPDNCQLMSRYDSKGKLRSGPYSIIRKRGNALVLSPTQPSFTITGSSYCTSLHWTKNKYEPKEYRFLGRLEIQRLMGFPDDYEFNPSKRKLQAPTYSKLIASGVQVDFTTNLLKHVVKELKL